jgi:hypothetical protein
MPVFKNLVELFSNLSPRRQRETEDQRSAAQRARPPPSTPPRSRPAGSGRNPFTLVPEEADLTETTSPQNTGISPLPTVCIFTYLYARPADICFWRSIFPLITRPCTIPSPWALVSQLRLFFSCCKLFSDIRLGTNSSYQVAHSYVDTFSSPTGSTTADEPLRTSYSHPFLSPNTRLDMSHRNPHPFPAGRSMLMPSPIPRPGDSSQMLNKDQQKDSQNRQDEARLFGARYQYVLPVCVELEILLLTGWFLFAW